MAMKPGDYRLHSTASASQAVYPKLRSCKVEKQLFVREQGGRMLDKLKPNITARLFLVGCPRSGTTLLQSLLSAHPQVFSVPESHLYSQLSSHNRVLRRLGIARRDAPETFSKVLVSLGLPPAKPRGVSVNFYLRQLAEALDKATLAEDKTIWLEKTPRHLYYLSDISRTLPGAKFIHVLRNGSDVIASLYEVTRQYPELWGGERSIDACINRWIRDVALSYRYQGKHNHVTVRYEELIAEPEACLRKLLAFLSIPFAESMLTDYRRASGQVVASGEAWKASVQESIQDTRNRKFERVFTPEKQIYVLERVRSHIAQL